MQGAFWQGQDIAAVHLDLGERKGCAAVARGKSGGSSKWPKAGSTVALECLLSERLLPGNPVVFSARTRSGIAAV